MKRLLGLLVCMLPLLSAAEVVVPIDSVEYHVNIRMSPDAKSEIVGRLFRGDSAVVVRSIPEWHEVEIAGGATGFISVDWTILLDEVPAPVAEVEAAPEPQQKPFGTASVAEEVSKQAVVEEVNGTDPLFAVVPVVIGEPGPQGETGPPGPPGPSGGAYVNTGGVWTDSSSREQKENIVELTPEEALAALAKLEPVTFNYKQEDQEQYIGFIAEDVPELVASSDRTGLSAIDIVAVLTRVVKLQQQQIAELESRLEEHQ
jgi:hypothetical protein